MSNRTLFMRWFAAVFSMMFLTACMSNLFDARSGKVAVTVKWPAKSGFRVQAIPETTARITLTIVGEGLDAGPIQKDFTPSADESREITEVPIGPKALTAVAYDDKGTETARGQVTVVVRPNAITDARLVLEAGTIDIPIGSTPPSPNPGESPVAPPSALPSAGPDFIVRTVAGDGRAGATDGYASIDGRFKYPQALAYDAKNDWLFIADTEFKLIRKYDVKTTVLTTVAGQAPADESAVPALGGAALGTPSGLAIGPDGRVYFSDLDTHSIRRLNADGTVSTVAGSGRPGPAKENVTAFEASFYYPVAIAFDANGALYVADQFNHKIRRLSPRGTITTIAGTGEAGDSGDGGPAVEARINFPTALALDPKGEYLYVAEAEGHKVRRIHLATSLITTVAGTGAEGVAGENGPATAAQLGLPLALTFDVDGALLIAEGWAAKLGPDTKVSFTNRVLKVKADGTLVRLAGPKVGNYGFSGDGDDALKAVFNNPAGIAVDATGLIYVADSYNNRIRALQRGVAPAPAPTAEPSPAPEATPTAAP
jgi:sugar lactone lactonase YvrE